MNDEQRSQLIERYEEAAISLLMDEYAEAEGARLLHEFKEASKKGDVPEVPEDLDAKCRQLIQASFAKQERKVQLRQVTKAFAKVAIFVFVLLGLVTTAVLSVDALRVPVLNFFLQGNERYATVILDENQDKDNLQNDIMNRMYTAPVPDGYQLKITQTDEDGFILVYYENDAGQGISLTVRSFDGVLNIDADEDGQIEMSINEYDAVFVEKDGYRITWTDPEKQLVYELYANEIALDQFWELVYYWAA